MSEPKWRLAVVANRLISFFQRTEALLAEAEQCIYAFSVVGDIDRIEMLHERLSEAGETVMEASGLLDPVNEVHLLSLHLVFLQEINKSLKEFGREWNYHGLN